MITSMTGFASGTVTLLEHENEQCLLDIEIKTFNSRFFEPSCKLPGNLSAYEMEIISRLKRRLQRGRVYCTVRVSGYGALLERLVFLPTRVEEYLETVKELKNDFKIKGDLTVNEAISLPNIFSTERTQLPEDAIERFLDGIDKVIDGVVKTRQEEGERLKDDLDQRFGHAGDLITQVREANLELLKRSKEQIAQHQAKAQEGDDEARAILSERYGALDKMDVHEELVRFTSHLQAVRDHIASDKLEKGRKFDFILQELMREINTIMAKCSSYQVSSYAVDIKVELEKAREQVQNIV